MTHSTDLPSNVRKQNTESLDLEMDVIWGEMPPDCEGHAFWVVPTPQRGENYGTPWFNGYAQLYRLDFHNKGIHLKSEQFRTPSVICDQKIQEQPWWKRILGKKIYKFRNLGGLARLSFGLGIQNQCNTALQAFKDPDDDSWRMFATVDSGRPFEFDLETLKPITPVGRRDEWQSIEIKFIKKVKINNLWIFPMHISGAHTAYDIYDKNTKELFLINCISKVTPQINPNTYIHIWDGKSDLKTTKITYFENNEEKPIEIKQSTHQIAVTKNYIVIVDTAFFIEYWRMLNPEISAQAHSAYNRVWLVPRCQLNGDKAVAQYLEISNSEMSTECVHFYADYEDNNGQDLTLHTVLASGHDVSEWVQKKDETWETPSKPISSDFYGSPPGVYDRQGFGKYVINTRTNKIKENYRFFEDYWGIALPTYAGIQGTSQQKFQNFWVNYGGYISEITPKRLVELYHYDDEDHRELRQVEAHALPDWRESGILRYSPVDMKVKDSCPVERGYGVNTPVYVPKKGQKDELEGYIIAMVSTPNRDYPSQFWIWKAGKLCDGPIAKLSHKDVKFAFPLHSAWIPSIAPRTAKYKVDIRQDMDIDDADYRLPEWIKKIFRHHIYPKFK